MLCTWCGKYELVSHPFWWHRKYELVFHPFQCLESDPHTATERKTPTDSNQHVPVSGGSLTVKMCHAQTKTNQTNLYSSSPLPAYSLQG